MSFPDPFMTAMTRPEEVNLGTIYGRNSETGETHSLADAIVALFLSGGGAVSDFYIEDAGLSKRLRTDRPVRIICPVEVLGTIVVIDGAAVFRDIFSESCSVFFTFNVTYPAFVRITVGLIGSVVDGVEGAEDFSIKVTLEALGA